MSRDTKALAKTFAMTMAAIGVAILAVPWIVNAIDAYWSHVSSLFN